MVSEKRQLIKDLKKAGVYKKPVLAGERVSQAYQKYLKEPYKRGVKPSTPSARSKRISQVARKAISLAAPKGSMVRAITRQTKKKGDRGRGRPSGTYKVRYLPSGRAVKVPTHIYKKMLSAEKSQMRLAKAQHLAQVQMQADQLAMQQDPRYQPSAEDQFLAEPDQQHEVDVMRAQQQADMAQAEQQYQPQRPSVGRRVVDRVSRMRLRSQGSVAGYSQPQLSNQYGQTAPLSRPDVRMGGIVREPQVTAISGKANLLNVSNRPLNNPEDSMLTEHRNINFFSNVQKVRVPDRSKLAFFNNVRRGYSQ